MITSELTVHAARLGRMPSRNELRAAGGGSLGDAMIRRGGFRRWSEQLGFPLKGTETHRGQKWERREAAFFAERGWTVSTHPCKHPFDLTVNGRRVDVKTASLGKFGFFQFGSVKRCRDCDFLDLLCVDGEVLLGRFVVPAESARVLAVAMMPNTLDGLGKYGAFRDRLDLLAR